MPSSGVRSSQIRDGEVWRDDLNTTTPGQAVVRKIIAGTGVNISETGVDTGTGDVTISVPTTQNTQPRTVTSTLARRIPGGSGVRYMTHDGNVSHTDCGFILSQARDLKEMNIVVDTADATNNYDVRIYRDPTTAPVLVVSATLTLLASNRTASATGLTINLIAGEYGIAIERTAGAGASDFRRSVVNLILEIP